MEFCSFCERNNSNLNGSSESSACIKFLYPGYFLHPPVVPIDDVAAPLTQTYA